jgi:anti-anti-sigma regulatory factor
VLTQVYQSLKSTGNGIVIDVSKVDFFDIFKIDQQQNLAN